MNNYRGILMFIIALIAAVGAVMISSKWLQQRSAQVNKVVVATQEINLGQKLTSSMFKVVDWPAANVPPQSFSDVSKLNGRVTKSSLQDGEPVLASKLAPEGSLGGLSAVISEGKRAITVRVNDVVGVAGFALPGNFVDIIVNTEKAEINNTNSGKNERSISKIVLEHILVLAVAQEAGRDETKPKVVNAVTLEVSPEQAEMIDLARSIGELSLVLRNQADVENTQTAGITQSQLLEIEDLEPMPAQIAAAPEQKVIIKRMAVKAKAVPVGPKNCTKVITGLTESKECF
jgi:pilus assembly protein CpaB